MELPTFRPLDQVFDTVQMSSIFYCPSDLTEPWGIELPPMDDCLWFHVVTEGACTLALHDGTEVLAHAGDVVVVPHGTGHFGWGDERVQTRSVLDLPHDDLAEHYGRLRHGGGGRRTELVCGGVRFDRPSTRHLIAALPALIHVRGADLGRTSWLRPTLDLLADEIREVRPGNEAIVSRLCDIIVIQAVRAWIEHDPGARSGWLGALHDPQIGVAIAAIHTDPGAEWSVANLAAVATMSRSAFAARFTELVGEPAMAYVTRWRMFRAAALIESGAQNVSGAGRAVGYDSEAAFSRAFKREMGMAPSSFAQAARTHQKPGSGSMTPPLA